MSQPDALKVPIVKEVSRKPESDIKREEIDKKIRELEKEKSKLEGIPGNEEEKQELNKLVELNKRSDHSSVKGSVPKIETSLPFGMKPNITPFSGREPTPKNEASYEDFKIEFESLKPIYSEQVLREALRKSLREQARKTMLHLGPTASIDTILKSLEETFGNIASEDTLLSKFLLAEQNQDESLVEWGLRLEEIMLQVSRKSKMNTKEQNLRLKNRFWRGLRNEELKNATRTHFEGPASYEELRNKVRAEEFEMQLQKERIGVRPKTAKVHQIAEAFPSNNMMATLLKQIEGLNRKVEEMKKAQDEQLKEKKSVPAYAQPYREGFRGNRGRGAYRGDWRNKNRNRQEGVEKGEMEDRSEPKHDQTPLNG